jgi:predicted transcriptional regulator with HTH domain
MESVNTEVRRAALVSLWARSDQSSFVCQIAHLSSVDSDNVHGALVSLTELATLNVSEEVVLAKVCVRSRWASPPAHTPDSTIDLW